MWFLLPQHFGLRQARIHTGFHRFTEIGQVFHNKHIFNNNSRTFQVEIWKMVWTNVFFFQFPGSRQKPGKGSFRKLKPKKIPGGASGLPYKLAPSAPRLGNRSVFILDRRLWGVVWSTTTCTLKILPSALMTTVLNSWLMRKPHKNSPRWTSHGTKSCSTQDVCYWWTEVLC